MVDPLVAGTAEAFSVFRIVLQVGPSAPRCYVVSMDISIIFPTALACVIVALSDDLLPLLISVASRSAVSVSRGFVGVLFYFAFVCTRLTAILSSALVVLELTRANHEFGTACFTYTRNFGASK
jgi:hypothetical protein